jgi:hypothetical protein
MSVGLHDADMSAYLLVPFNLEIMKLSAYYKRKGEIVVLSPSFTPDRNTKFIYRKDYDDGDYPRGLMRYSNVEYGGLAFSHNVYKPLPLEIERMKPDTSIYSRMESKILGPATSERRKIYNNMIEAEHCRLSLDGKTIWPEYTKQFKNLKQARNLMIHDYDLGAIDGAFEEVQKLMARARTDGWATRLGMKFPVQVSRGEDLLKWSTLRSNSTFYSLRFNGVIDNESFQEWVERCYEKSIYNQMEYHVTDARYDENHFTTCLLPQILRQVIFSRRYRVSFSLTYDEGYFSDPRWEEVIRLFNFYHTSFMNETEAVFYKKIEDDTLFDFAASTMKRPYGTYGQDAMSVADVRKIFEFVREHNYPLFKDFYECNARSLGGKL